MVISESMLTVAQSYCYTFWPAVVALAIVLGTRRLFAVPSELAHLPRVPVLPTILSYASGESDDVRLKRLVLPFANEKGEGVVVLFAFGRWIVHVLDYKIAKDIFDNNGRFPKADPPPGLLIWKLVGYSNIVLSNGDAWKRLSKVVKPAVNRNVPLEEFSRIARQLFSVMDAAGGELKHWDNLMMRYTLDAIGASALGHYFNALAEPNSPFITQYSHVMDSIADPLYILLPILERIRPRTKTLRDTEDLVTKFEGLLELKKANKGNDMYTYMLEEPGITDVEYRDNIISLFIGGHDTTAGAMSSLTYYLAKQPELQRRAREEVLSALKDNVTGDPTMEELRQMPFVHACIREALRLNTPLAYLTPREAAEPCTFTGGQINSTSGSKSYFIPKGTSILVNITCIHYNEHFWPDATSFKPDRFMDVNGKDASGGAWLPFAAGARQCPARNFAMYELRTLACMLLREWEWVLPINSPHHDAIKNGFSPFALSLPKGLYVNFRRRNLI